MNEAPSGVPAGELAFAQHRGLVSRQQQDALLVGGDLHQSPNLLARLLVVEGTSGLCALADGVASSPCPQRASRAVLEALNTVDSRQETWLQDGWIGPRLIRRHVHAQLCRQLARDRRTRGAASTLALLQWRGNRCSLVNVGDSRIYRIDRGGRWERLSRDHTYFESMVERGEITRDQSVGQLYHDLEHMLMADEEEDGFAIHWRQVDGAAGDTFMLCTDGLHDTLGEAQLAALYRPDRPLREQAAGYLDAVLRAGAPDNVSLILVRLAVSDTLSNAV
ncbi:MAG: protein phosphatase 2C domain-containing protein [Chromatiaceae bacterium]